MLIKMALLAVLSYLLVRNLSKTMKLILCTDVQRCEGNPLFTVKVQDIDSPANFHSYNCLFFKQGSNLDELKEQAECFISNIKEK